MPIEVIVVVNEEIKKEYLGTIDNVLTHNKTKQSLEKFSGIEDKLGIDICEFNRKQAKDALEECGLFELLALEGQISQTKLYARWCYDKGYFPGAHYGILGIKASELNPQKELRNNIILTEDELFNGIGIATPLHDGYVEAIACVFAWLGVPKPLEILESDVFLDGRKILHDGKVIVDGMSDRVYDFLVEYRKLKTSTRTNGNGTYPVYRDDSYDTFIKQYTTMSDKRRGKKLEPKIYQSAIWKMNERIRGNHGNPKFSYDNILRSGCLSRLYAAEKNGLDVFDRKNEETVEGYFGRTRYRSIVWLYRNYKEAFNL